MKTAGSLTSDELVEKVGAAALPLTGAQTDYDRLIDRASACRFVLLGEATHGTHEFYQQRAEITKRLICEQGFTAVAVEADWPDAYRINRYVRGRGDDGDAEEALGDFKRFPTWMWRNADALDFVGWLRDHNEHLDPESQVGFYGLDLYSLHTSIESVLTYLKKVDPESARRARARYSCFEDFGQDSESYARGTQLGLSAPCEEEVIAQLIDLRRRAADYLKGDGPQAIDDYFFAEQNARLVKNAEEYYRSMFQEQTLSWNVRDRHMVEMLEALVAHFQRERREQKVVLWEHNSHLGDARATQMGERGELNVGQLVRERHAGEALLVGFTTHSGSVTAASEWDAPAERKKIRPALPESFESIFHETGHRRFFLDLGEAEIREALAAPRLERAIGVIYLPESERFSHYFRARLSAQFDAVLHFDETRAVEPLERSAPWKEGEVPETFPSSL